MLPPYLSDDHLHALIQRALREDLGDAGDVTTAATVPEGATAGARIQTREEGVVAGLRVAEGVFQAVDPAIRLRWNVEDGSAVEPDRAVGRLEGSARGLLTAERLALNLLQRMSGIATATRRMVDAAGPHDTMVLDTRKTAPGLRLLDKWAVRLGGGRNHRLGLYDMILIKDNHIAAAGGIQAALEAAHRHREGANAGDEPLPIEIETRTLEDVRSVLAAADRGTAPDMVLLDNMARRDADGALDVSTLREAVALIDGRFRTEASGNVTLQTAGAIAATGVDALSSGALTHSTRALDLGMTFEV